MVGNVGLHSVDLIGNSVEEHLLAKRLLYHSALGAAADLNRRFNFCIQQKENKINLPVVDVTLGAAEQVAVAIIKYTNLG